MIHTSCSHEKVLDEGNKECLDDVVGCVRNVQRHPQVEVRVEESQERADTDLQTGDIVGEVEIENNLGK